MKAKDRFSSQDRPEPEAILIAPEDGEERFRTLSEEIVRTVADDIIYGRIAPNTKLEETELAKRFGSSRTPVREALGQICAMGLAVRLPYRGVMVTAISAGRLGDMYVVMAELEAAAARLSAVIMSPTERHVLERMHDSSRELVRSGDCESYAAHNTNLHTLIYDGSHNGYLKENLVATRRRLSPFRRAQLHAVGRLASSFNEHETIIRAILRGDAETAATLMRSHVLSASATSAAYVDSLGRLDPMGK